MHIICLLVFRKPDEITARLRQEIESAKIHSKYWPSLSTYPPPPPFWWQAVSFFAKETPPPPLFLRTRPGLALLNYLPYSTNTISCINHSNDPSDRQVQKSLFLSYLPPTRLCKSPPHRVWRSIEMLQLCALALNPQLVLVLLPISSDESDTKHRSHPSAREKKKWYVPI